MGYMRSAYEKHSAKRSAKKARKLEKRKFKIERKAAKSAKKSYSKKGAARSMTAQAHKRQGLKGTKTAWGKVQKRMGR
jgi:hypothetical protein